jgi:hypothetical protein
MIYRCVVQSDQQSAFSYQETVNRPSAAKRRQAFVGWMLMADR